MTHRRSASNGKSSAGTRRPAAAAGLLLLAALTVPEGAFGQFVPPVLHNVTNDLPHGARTHPWDADLDGDVDLLLSFSLADAVYLALNTAGDGSAWQRVLVGPNVVATMALPFDADCDGDKDVAALSFLDREQGFESLGKVVWLERPANLTTSPWTESVIDATLVHVWCLDVGDLDDDGDDDLVMGTRTGTVPNGIYFYENRCGEVAGPRWQRWTIAVDPDVIVAGSTRIGRIDGDRFPDVVVADLGGNRLTWFEAGGNPRSDSWTRHDLTNDTGAFAGPMSARLHDMDGDGDLDVLAALESAGRVVWLEHPADPTTTPWAAHDVDPALPAAKEVTRGDFDNDGRPDVAAVSQQEERGGTNSMAIYRAEADGTFTRLTPDGNYFGASTVDTADVDGDGDADVLSASYGGDSTDWWENANPVPTAGNPKEAGIGNTLRATKGPGGTVSVTFAAACGATDHAVYWGQGPIRVAADWAGGACHLGTSGSAVVDPGQPAGSHLSYFVAVGQIGAREGSYGRDSLGGEHPPAVFVRDCDRVRNFAGSCP